MELPRIPRVPGRGLVAAALPGIALVAVAMMLVVLFGALDATHRHPVQDLLMPDPVAAAGTLALVG